VNVRLISERTCEQLFAAQAGEWQGQAIGAAGVWPVTTSTRHYNSATAISDNQPWWVHHRCDAEHFQGLLYVDAGLPLFAGHFPDNPILPGVVQIDWAVSIAQEMFAAAAEQHFSGMSRIKFRAPVQPGAWLRVSLRLREGAVDFEFADHSVICTQGRLHYHV